MLTHERLLEVLRYDPSTGDFTWRKTLSSRSVVGHVAGSMLSNGYRRIAIDKKTYLAHRLAWFYVHGMWPTDEIDHINRSRIDNRLANLRECTHSENHQNRGLSSTNKSGYQGVSWFSRQSCWAAHITVAGKSKHIGYFDTPEEAHNAYKVVKRTAHRF